MLNKIKEEIMSNPKKRNILIVVLFIVLIFIVFSSFVTPKKGNESAKVDEISSVKQYEKELEEKITSIINDIEGVGNTKVMVTLDSVVSYEYVKESKENIDSVLSGEDITSKKANYEEKYIFIEDQNGKKQALVKKQLAPQIKGVVIVCDGGDKPVIISMLVETISTIFDIKSTQISISKLKN